MKSFVLRWILHSLTLFLIFLMVAITNPSCHVFEQLEEKTVNILKHATNAVAKYAKPLNISLKCTKKRSWIRAATMCTNSAAEKVERKTQNGVICFARNMCNGRDKTRYYQKRSVDMQKWKIYEYDSNLINRARNELCNKTGGNETQKGLPHEET